MKKILCIAPYTFLPAKTGGQKSIASFYNNLSRHFIVACIGTKQNETSAASYKMFKLLSSSSLRYLNPINFFRIKKIVLDEKPDYIQLDHPYLGWLPIVLRRTTGVKLIVRSHNIEAIRFRNLNKWWWPILLRYEGWVHRNADINYFVTDEDRDYAVKHFKIAPQTAHTITFGIDRSSPPTTEQKDHARSVLLRKHNLKKEDILILFNGAFDYHPNLVALHLLIDTIFPTLQGLSHKPFKLLLCGKDLPPDLVAKPQSGNIIFAGFVSDINDYLAGADLFANPITEGGGIKTKLVEAIGFGLTCVSFKSGAIGVPEAVCGSKLVIVNDHDSRVFAEAIIEASNTTLTTPESFYNRFSYQEIMEKLKGIL
jgi:glycosyltransferase involved in cell wall biosynthesis